MEIDFSRFLLALSFINIIITNTYAQPRAHTHARTHAQTHAKRFACFCAYCNTPGIDFCELYALEEQVDPSVKRQIEADMEEASQLVFHSKIEVNSTFNSANV